MLILNVTFSFYFTDEIFVSGGGIKCHFCGFAFQYVEVQLLVVSVIQHVPSSVWCLAKNTLHAAFCKGHHLSEFYFSPLRVLFLLGVLKEALFAFVYLSFLFS